ncbi:MAG: DUF4924 family protein [Bacteroidales bacterium]
MIIAQEKKASNIAEYILYMWQIEDMIRAYNFDIQKIKENIINQFDQPDDIKEEMTVWYNDLVNKMKEQEIAEQGHLDFINHLIQELDDLHRSLLHDPDELEYIDAYNKAKPAIEDLRSKSKKAGAGDIEICLEGLYGILLLRLQKKPLNASTQEALATISHMMALLNTKYQKTKQTGDKNNS